MSSLFELTGDFLRAKEMLLDEEIDIETIQNTLDCIDCLFEEKADNYAKILQYIEGDIFIIKNELERLNERKKILENRSKALKENLKQNMELTGKKKFKTALHSFSIQKNGGVQPIKIDVDVKEIPEEYLIPQPAKPNIAAIRETLEKQTLAWAHFEKRGTSLRIR